RRGGLRGAGKPQRGADAGPQAARLTQRDARPAGTGRASPRTVDLLQAARVAAAQPRAAVASSERTVRATTAEARATDSPASVRRPSHAGHAVAATRASSTSARV